MSSTSRPGFEPGQSGETTQQSTRLDKVTRYRHAQLAAVPVSGDLNAKIDNLSQEELLASIKEEWAKLGPMLDLDVVPQGSTTENGLTVGTRAIEHGSISGA
jgi:hypothetical protein